MSAFPTITFVFAPFVAFCGNLTAEFMLSRQKRLVPLKILIMRKKYLAR
jgi:hypothetical protein